MPEGKIIHIRINETTQKELNDLHNYFKNSNLEPTTSDLIKAAIKTYHDCLIKNNITK